MQRARCTSDSITTSERCELKDKSKINGDIKSKVFSMEEGASLSGRTEIGG